MVKNKSNFLTLTAVAVVGSMVTFFVILGASRVNAPQREFTGGEDHVITIDQAVKFIQNFKNSPTAPTIKGAYFGRNIFDKILSQPDCAGLRYYYAKKDDGTATLVLVGVDGSGNDMTQGVLADYGWPCPPMCGAPNQLNR